jgi:hypothetical protein
MNQIARSNLTDDLIRVINMYSPEYIELSGNNKPIWDLIDAIEMFNDECDKGIQDELDKQNGLVEQNSKLL